MSFRQNSDAPVLFDEPSSPPNFSSSSPNSSTAHARLIESASSESMTHSFVARAEEPAETAVSRSRRSVPKAAYAIVPSFLFLGLALATRSHELATTTSTRSGNALQIEGRNAILAASQTLIVPATTSSAPATNAPLMLPAVGSVVWRARLEPVVDVVGRAPITGQITRVWARTGQNVSVGDRILRILSYSNNVVTVPPRARNYDKAAEEEQVQAVRAQGALGTRLSSAQARLKSAQSRVTRAQSRVDEAMSVVRKLQSGDVSGTDDIEYSRPEADAPQENPSGINASEVQAAQATSERSSQAAQNAKDEAVAAEREAARAESDAQDKSRRARELQQTRDIAKTAMAKAAMAKAAMAKAAKASEPTGNATSNNAAPVAKSPVAKPEVPSVSANAVSEAESSAREAASRASSLRSKANVAKSVADQAESRAQDAARRAKESLRSLQLFNDDAPAKEAPAKDAPAPRRRTSTRSSKKRPSIGEASRMVREATTESRQASREAERWKTEVDAYSRQARQTQQRIATSEQNLGSAQQEEQQQELDTTLQRNLSIVRAPANGAIVQIGDVGDNVSFGDAIVMVGKTGVLRAQFSDTSGLWRKLKRGSTLPATVSMSNERASGKSAPSSTRSSSNRPRDVQSVKVFENAISVVARVEEVEEPSQKGAPALVKTTVRTVVSAAMRPTAADNAANAASATLVNPTPNSMRLRAGMTILCSVDGVSITANAIANRATDNTENGDLVLPQEAVVMLEDGTSTREVSGDAQNANETRAYVAVLRPDENGDFSIEWREVQVEVQTQGAATPAVRLVRGLVAGERVALNAVVLRELSLNYGNDAKVILRDSVQRDAAQEELK